MQLYDAAFQQGIVMKKMKRLLLAALCALVPLQSTGCTEEKNLPYEGARPMGDNTIAMDTALWGELNTHDPSIIKVDDRYYVFSTDASLGDIHQSGVQVRVSKDLITWEYLGTAFENYAQECAGAVAYAGLDTEKGQGFWAPDIIRYGDCYRLYFSASTFGSSRSCIALAEADQPEGPYRYKGIVISSEANALKNPNCIDPGITVEEDGRMYMVYGSFFGGIFIAELDSETGLLQKTEEPVHLAGGQHASIEGPVIRYIPETGYYYLFVSYGSLSSDYNIRVARAESITGPYLDAAGNDMKNLAPGNEERIGTKLMGGHTFLSSPPALATKGVMAPGHNGLLIDGEDYFIVHHTRSYSLPDYWFKMQVRRFAMNDYGWPVILPNCYDGESFEAADLPDGSYALVAHGADNNDKSHDSKLVELSGGDISGAYTGTYTLYDDYRIALTLDGIEYNGVVAKQFDRERKSDVTAFSAMSETGLTVWGSTQQ